METKLGGIRLRRLTVADRPTSIGERRSRRIESELRNPFTIFFYDYGILTLLLVRSILLSYNFLLLDFQFFPFRLHSIPLQLPGYRVSIPKHHIPFILFHFMALIIRRRRDL